MSDKTKEASFVNVIRENFRVEVGVPEARYYGWSDTASDRYFNEMMRRGKELAAQVDRHCDGEDRAEVKFDIRYECKLCKREWELYQGQPPCCCDEAVNAWEERDDD